MGSVPSKERLPGQSWPDYSRRSCSEVRENFQRLIFQTDFRKEALEWNFPPAFTGSLVFVAYFITESDLAELETLKLT
jgi:hypothetical protein